jgi:hypothetical protein
MALPSISKNIEGNFYGYYFGIDATAKMLLYSGGQVPNVSKALNQKLKHRTLFRINVNRMQ